MSLSYIGSRRVLVKNIKRQLTPCGAWWNRKTDLCEAGLGGTIIQDILKAFTYVKFNVHSETWEISRYMYCLEHDNGKCPWVWYTFRILAEAFIVFWHFVVQLFASSLKYEYCYISYRRGLCCCSFSSIGHFSRPQSVDRTTDGSRFFCVQLNLGSV